MIRSTMYSYVVAGQSTRWDIKYSPSGGEQIGLDATWNLNKVVVGYNYVASQSSFQFDVTVRHH